MYNNAGALLFVRWVWRPLRINWLIVGTFCLQRIKPEERIDFSISEAIALQ
jgi:hypothetical protein